MHRKLKILGIAILILLIAVCFVIANKYLSSNHLLMYATGTNDKAFLNATWKMSPQEIVRANKMPLSMYENIFLFSDVDVADRSRVKAFTQKDVSLWGYTPQVVYMFFDNMLYSTFAGVKYL